MRHIKQKVIFQTMEQNLLQVFSANRFISFSMKQLNQYIIY